MKTNRINIEESLRFWFQNKKYVSSTYRIVRDENGESADTEDSVLIRGFSKTENLGLLLRFYDLRDINGYSVESELVEKIPFYDLVMHFRNSKNVRSLEVTNDGMSATLDGNFFVDLPEDKIKKIYGNQIVYVLGFCGSNFWCQFFSPLIGFEENKPSTWEIFTSTNHRITPVSNLTTKRLFENF